MEQVHSELVQKLRKLSKKYARTSKPICLPDLTTLLSAMSTIFSE